MLFLLNMIPHFSLGFEPCMVQMKETLKCAIDRLGYSATTLIAPHPPPVANLIKALMIVNYDSRVIIWGNFKSGTTLEF